MSESISTDQIAEKLDALAYLWVHAEQVVVLTGAGISAESGVPTFRGQDGLWKSFRAEELASMSAFLANPKLVWEWYNWRRELIANILPNAGHYALAELSRTGPRFSLITQNVDGLHTRAGSKDLLELHGNISVNRCSSCDRIADTTSTIDLKRIPGCTYCGELMRPGVVWFGENLDEEIMDLAHQRCRNADLCLVVGTSALVYPASQLPIIAKQHGASLVELNLERTPLSDLADISILSSAGAVLPQLLSLVCSRSTEREETEIV